MNSNKKIDFTKVEAQQDGSYLVDLSEIIGNHVSIEFYGKDKDIGDAYVMDLSCSGVSGEQVLKAMQSIEKYREPVKHFAIKFADVDENTMHEDTLKDLKGSMESFLSVACSFRGVPVKALRIVSDTLRALEFIDDSIYDFPEKMHEIFPMLDQIFTEECGIESLPQDFHKMTSLKSVSFVTGRFTKFPDQLCKMPHLVEINLESCKISGRLVFMSDATMFPVLEELNLAGNSIKKEHIPKKDEVKKMMPKIKLANFSNQYYFKSGADPVISEFLRTPGVMVISPKFQGEVDGMIEKDDDDDNNAVVDYKYTWQE
jgi:hypothetical protein